MLLNEELSKRTLIKAGLLDWVPSPTQGVERRMLFRLGAEKARATSIVRYAPGSLFPRHAHSGGEEFLVLDGVFQDETGDFPVGTYVRNPPGSSHAPGSADGCTIFVRLWQFATEDQQRVVCRPGEGRILPLRSGVTASRLLFERFGEKVVVEDWEADTHQVLVNPDGLELLVLSGGLTEGGDELTRWSWLRLPAGMPFDARIGTKGARVWFKSAPLLHPDVCAFDATP
ncbi:cupin [Gluconobacter japonicus]|uniref:cupin domain-containing protein n=1 Tax=Gluconobacter japonicus TaxID=376620 RepID=UPI000780FDFD|nr:cupin domain-containing protein [Gluconobacter japonicus]KXV23817.1 cupin [Gluconobacter japonicus]KXV41629.1 cupin [Gluconobacter japonicus]